MVSTRYKTMGAADAPLLKPLQYKEPKGVWAVLFPIVQAVPSNMDSRMELPVKDLVSDGSHLKRKKVRVDVQDQIQGQHYDGNGYGFGI